MTIRKSPAGPSVKEAAAPSTGKYRIQAIDRAVAILNCFSAAAPELHVREVSARTGLHKATVHRILMAMQHHSMVEQDAATGRYHLGLQLVRLGEHAVRRLDVSVIARPVLVDLTARTGERSHLAVLDGDQIVILERVDGVHSLLVPSLPGRLFAAHTTSLGKAILAALDDGEVRSLMGQRPLQRVTPRTPATVSALIEDLQRARKKGYVTSEEELSIGLSSVGVAILDRSGAPVAAINVSGSSSRIRGARLAALGAEVKNAAATISARLGHRQVAPVQTDEGVIRKRS